MTSQEKKQYDDITNKLIQLGYTGVPNLSGAFYTKGDCKYIFYNYTPTCKVRLEGDDESQFIDFYDLIKKLDNELRGLKINKIKNG